MRIMNWFNPRQKLSNYLESGRAAIIHKISETNSSFHVKYGTSSISIFQKFLISIEKVSFWQENWAVVYNSTKFCDSPDFS